MPVNEDWVARITALFNAIDSVLSLHYSANTSDPVLANLLDHASLYAHRRINFAIFEVVLYLVPTFYVVYPDYQQPQAIHLYRISPPKEFLPLEFTKNIDSRRREFGTALKNWLENNKNMDYIPATRVQDAAKSNNPKSQPESPTKSNSPRKLSPSPTKVSKLKNDASRFRFKERLETVELAKTGLSLLERIKLKERLKSEENIVTPQQKYETYLAGNIQPVYNIIFQRCSQEKLPKLLLFAQLVTTIRDSFSFPISEQEAEDSLRFLETKIPSMALKTVAGITVLWVESIDRSRDLSFLEDKVSKVDPS